MKMIVVLLRPEQLETVRVALEQLDVCPTSVSQVVDLGPGPGDGSAYRGRDGPVRPTRLRLELAVDDWPVESVLEAIVRAGVTSQAGPQEAGKVFVLPLDECVSLRRGQPGAVTHGTWRGHPYHAD